MTAVAQRQPRSLVVVPAIHAPDDISNNPGVMPKDRKRRIKLVRRNPSETVLRGWAKASLASMHKVTDELPKRARVRLRLGWIGIAAWVALAATIVAFSAAAEKRTDGVRVEAIR